VNWISPVTLISVKRLEYQAPGEVFEVYDTNGAGQHIPVEFTRCMDGTRFRLKYQPFGVVHAQHPGPRFAGMRKPPRKHWWIRTRVAEPILYAGDTSLRAVQYVPWWAWPIERAYQLMTK
jgi:hypothetical protein